MLTKALLTVLAIALGPTEAQLSKCAQGENCRLPNCFCPTFRHPHFANVKDIPQMVYFGFDDALHGQVDQFYKPLFAPSRKNPNGCPITMSLFVQDQWTSYPLVNAYHRQGMEIGSHSVTHTNVDTEEKLIFEAGRQKDNLTNIGGVPRDEVVGWRSPNLKPAGDAQPEVLKSLGYTYDISLTYTRRSATDPIPWPYTLDYGYPYTCSVQPCPGFRTSHPGFWEIPVHSLYDPETHYPCAFVDSCRPTTEAAAFEYLWSNFQNAYTTNRAPFGLNMHAAWFFVPANLKATHTFIERLLELDDVYVITAKQVLAWMRNPVKVSEVSKLPEWGCNGSPSRPPATTACDCPPAVHNTVQPPVTSGPVRPTPGSAPAGPAKSPVVASATGAPSPVLITFSRQIVTNAVNVFAPPPQDPTIRPAPHPSGVLGNSVCIEGVNCKLPACACRSLKPPAELSLQNTPQIVYLTFTGPVDGTNYQQVLGLLNSSARHNPNNCPIAATFFVPRNGNYIPYIQGLRSRGHEISMYGNEASEFSNGSPLDQQVSEEVKGFQSLDNSHGLAGNAGAINLGYRSPSSRLGDPSFQGLSASKVLYDASLAVSRSASQTDVIPWPYTLDYGWKDCSAPGQCPEGRYPGLWEVPNVPVIDYRQQFPCVYADACNNLPPSVQDTHNFFMKNLEHSLNTNRAPLGINLRREWFSHPVFSQNLQGLQQFLNTVLRSRSDVFVVSIEKMLDWLKNPTELNQIASFEPWKC